MSNPSGKKGSAFQASLLPLVERYWPHSVSLGKQGVKDKGDFHMPGNTLYVLEAKNEKTLKLPVFWNETLAEASNAGTPFGVLVHKRKLTTAPEDQWATMSFGKWLELVHRIGAGSAGTTLFGA